MNTECKNATKGNSHIKSYVIRAGRFSKGQQAAYERGKGTVVLPRPASTYNFKKIFGNKNPVVVEIGFGSGNGTAEIARNATDTNFIGIEVYKPGIGNLCKRIAEEDIKNIRIIEGDAYEIIRDNIPGESVSGVHLFFPDPWPKKRHHKRRLVRFDFVPFLVKIMESGGYLYFVTDWEDYAEQALNVCGEAEGLENMYRMYAPPQSWRPVTRFHRKGTEENRRIFELLFKRV